MSNMRGICQHDISKQKCDWTLEIYKVIIIVGVGIEGKRSEYFGTLYSVIIIIITRRYPR